LPLLYGQLVGKYKLACSIVFYIAFYIGAQIISSIILVAVNIETLLDASLDSMALTRSIYGSLLPTVAILHLVLGILFYVITFFVIRKKVNLD